MADIEITYTHNLSLTDNIGVSGGSQRIVHGITVGQLYSFKIVNTTRLEYIDMQTMVEDFKWTLHHVTPIVVEHTITVSDSMIVTHEKIIQDNIRVSPQITARVDPISGSSDSVSVGQQIIVYVDRGSKNPDDYEQVDEIVKAQYDALEPPGNLTMTCGALSIELPLPEFGNKITYHQSRVEATTRGGDLIIYYDKGVTPTAFVGFGKKWPTSETLEFDFAYLDDENSLLLKGFLLATVGLKITVIDYMGLTWQGYIINPETEILQAGRFNFKSNTIRFQGVLQS